MPKMKSHRGAAKRFRLTGTGKLKRGKAYKSHKLGSKAPKRKRHLRLTGYVHVSQEKTIRKILPYL